MLLLGMVPSLRTPALHHYALDRLHDTKGKVAASLVHFGVSRCRYGNRHQLLRHLAQRDGSRSVRSLRHLNLQDLRDQALH